MRTYLFCMAFVLAACSNDNAPSNGMRSESAPKSTVTKPSDVTAAKKRGGAVTEITTYNLPFGLPVMSDSRLISGTTKFSGPTRHGRQALSTIAVIGSVQDIISFYETALIEQNFEITHNKIYDETSGTLHGENSLGAKLQVSAMRGGSKSRPGESTAALLAMKPNTAE